MPSKKADLPRRLSKTRLVTSIAFLLALSILFETIPSFRVFWGMKIDFVGAVWVLAFFLYGLSEALIVSILTTMFILVYSPTGFVGAAMKLVATLPMFLIPALMLYLPFLRNRASRPFNSILVISAAGILAILARLVIASFANYYWAIPIYLGKPSDIVMKEVFGGSILTYIAWIASMNVFQGIVDILVPWFLAFKLKIAQYFGT